MTYYNDFSIILPNLLESMCKGLNYIGGNTYGTLMQENNLFAKGDGLTELHNMDIDLNLLFGYIEKRAKKCL